MFGNHGLGGLLEEGAHGKFPKCLGGNLGDFGEFCKGLQMAAFIAKSKITDPKDYLFIVIDDNSRKLYVAI